MYGGKTQLLIENPINRYLINSPTLPGMNKNADGSLTLYKKPTGCPRPTTRWSAKHACSAMAPTNAQI
jgi:hypothetical protein